jgi:transposase
MIELTQDMRIMVAVKPAHFRSGIDALSGLCRSVLNEDPRGGSVFVFRNKSATAVKILAYQGRGFWLTHYHLCPYCISVDHSSAFSVRSLQRPLLG